MSRREVPQPSTDRMVEAHGHPLVVGVVPGQPELVVRTAEMWARACRATALYCAYVDTARYPVEEHPDGTVRHAPIDVDGPDEDWTARAGHLRDDLARVLAGSTVPWHVRYLAGRPDRALTHLARAVDASGYVVGTRAPGAGARVREVLEGSVAVRLSHHQHRPVLVVPLEVTDWAVTI